MAKKVKIKAKVTPARDTTKFTAINNLLQRFKFKPKLSTSHENLKKDLDSLTKENQILKDTVKVNIKVDAKK